MRVIKLFLMLALFKGRCAYSDVFLPTRTIRTTTAPNVLRALTTRIFQGADTDASVESTEDERIIDHHILPGDERAGCLFILALSSKTTPATLDLIRLAGLRVLNRIPENAVLVFAERSVVSALLLTGPEFIWAGKLLSSDKLESQLLVDLSKEAEQNSEKLSHIVVTLAIFDSEPQEALHIGSLMTGLLDLVKRDRMPIRQISLYSKRARQILIEMSGRIALGEKVKTISWLSRFCEISNINSATSNPSRASTQHLQIAMGGQEAMLRGR